MKDGRTGYLNGLAAEDIAVREYQARGAEILHQRWKCKEGEIDLIARQGGVLVFIEVKARKNHAAAAESLSPNQQQRLLNAANRYLAENGQSLDTETRFDLVTVDRAGRPEILENALNALW